MIQREACLGAEVVVVLIQEALLHPAVEAGAEASLRGQSHHAIPCQDLDQDLHLLIQDQHPKDVLCQDLGLSGDLWIAC